MTKDFEVIVKLGEESILLGADTEEEAIERAKQIIAEQYGERLSQLSNYYLLKTGE